MSLITRCPACQTMFKVVPDQLKVSEGWVRCGQCEEIFDASTHMVQEGDPEPVPVSVHAPAPASVPASMPDFAATDVNVRALGSDAGFDAADLMLREMAQRPAPAAFAEDSTFIATQVDFSPTVLEDGLLHDSPIAGGRTEPSLVDPAPAAVADDAAVAEPATEAAPAAVRAPVAAAAAAPGAAGLSFVRQAQRKARWKRWPVRLALAVVAIVLALVLGAQVLLQEHDRLAAYHPGLRPLLSEACGLVGCEIQPLRQIDAVVIDGSVFTKLRGDVFRLSLTLRNTGPVVVAAPAVELALTDSLDQPLIRRVLQPSELGARQGAIAAKGELQGTLVLSVKGSVPAERIVGYRLLAFYP